MTDEQKAQAEKLLESMGFKIGFNHLPSRLDIPAMRKRGEWEKGINQISWKVEIFTKSGKMQTEFFQGLGHLPKELQFNTSHKISVSLADCIEKTLQTGRIFKEGIHNNISTGRALPAPDKFDVLHCLLSDASALRNYSTFEDWAQDMGYDTDSRKAEKIYQACRNTGADLLRILGGAGFDQLAELMSDY